MNRNKVLLLAMLLSLALACSMLNIDYGTQPGAQPASGGETQRGAPPSQPVSIAEGLASLNSYRTTISFTTKGPDPLTSSTIVYETQRSQEQDARYTNMTSTTVKEGVAEPNDGATEVYSIGNDQCTKSGDQWGWKSLAPNEAEMVDLATSMIGITPLVDTPTFVAAETVNGIPTNHFSFKVSALGVKSGAEVTTNQGDYWLAIDGQYLVKYTLIIETVVDPQANIMHLETLIDVKDINQPVSIVFPQACLDAKAAATPEPSNQNTPEPTANP
jgi:hypothetical protein